MCLRKIVLTSALFLPPQKQSEFQRLLKGIYQPILKIYVLHCGLAVDLQMFFNLSLSLFKDSIEL